jgi:hypothetical protein
MGFSHAGHRCCVIQVDREEEECQASLRNARQVRRNAGKVRKQALERVSILGQMLQSHRLANRMWNEETNDVV